MRTASSHPVPSILLSVLIGVMGSKAVLADSSEEWIPDANATPANPDDLTIEQCLQMPRENLDFGVLNVDSIEQWSGLEDWQFMTNTDYLALGLDENGPAYLRQKLEPTHKGSIHVVGKGVLAPSRTYSITQSVYLEPDFDWGGKNEGGKLGFGLGGGSTPTGGNLYQDGFSARLMWRGNKDGTARLAVYAYSSDRNQNLPYGDDYPLQDFEVPVGEWFKITMEVTSNSSTGASDGAVRVWANDQLKLYRDNIHWQAAGSQPVVDHIMFATFHGGNSSSWAPDHTVFARFSSVCWQPTEYTPPLLDEHGMPIVDGNMLVQHVDGPSHP
ncbi:polysaccharide lyase [Granulosicoccus sp. 3-233]|uniref:polysaccharide lyase n=1 Tax=Granulosicoccus sp. 3-233 TaxID=3417969 RepID=UPI003D32EF6C